MDSFNQVKIIWVAFQYCHIFTDVLMLDTLYNKYRIYILVCLADESIMIKKYDYFRDYKF